MIKEKEYKNVIQYPQGKGLEAPMMQKEKPSQVVGKTLACLVIFGSFKEQEVRAL